MPAASLNARTDVGTSVETSKRYQCGP
jgi:hypothetical protein